VYNERTFIHREAFVAPRTHEQNETIREVSRAKIVETALELFAQHGFEATSVRMIAQAAGIAQGLLYNYFASKEALLATVVQQSMADVRESFVRAEDGTDPHRQIERLIRAAFATVQRKRTFWKLIYGVRMQGAVVTSLGDVLIAGSTEIRTTIERYCRTAGLPQPEIEGAILFALIDGVAQHYVLDPENYPLDGVTEALVARYNTLLAKQGGDNGTGVA
jgi:AcrR family transcriptional regulator